MNIGDCIETDVKTPTVRTRLRDLKKRHGWTRRFAVKQWSPYFTRIWRIE